MTNTFYGLVVTLLTAVFGLTQVFDWWSPTSAQQGAILTLWGAIWGIVIALNARFGKAHEIRQAARAQGVSVPKV